MDRERTDYEDVLRRLTVNDPSTTRSILSDEVAALGDVALDERSEHLVRLGALIALDAGPSAIGGEVSSALAAGASRSDVVCVLLKVGPYVGSARLVGMAPRIAEAIGFDVYRELERPIGSGR